MSTDDEPGDVREIRGPMHDISNEMSRIYKEQFGRGPTRVRTNWSDDDTIVVTLEDTFTPAESSLRNMGEHQRLRDLRLFFQYANVKGFCEPVERITGRRVKSFISGIDTHEDLSVEMFVLHPQGYQGRGRGDSNGEEF